MEVELEEPGWMRRNEDFILFDYDVCFKDNCGHVALVKWFEF